MIWDFILAYLFFIGVIFIIMYVRFMGMVGESGVYSFKRMNKLFWEFFKESFGFTNKNS
jgi:hypothetical protein